MIEVSGTILGAGPSLVIPEKGNAVIALNRLTELSRLRSRPEVRFLAAEKMLSEDSRWVSQSKSLGKALFLGQELQGLLVGDGHLDFSLCRTLELEAAEHFADFRQEFPLPEFPLMNVALDYAIPFAMSLGWREIRLSGCDFNYGETSESPAYSSMVRHAGKMFKHDFYTKRLWAKSSQTRLRSIATWAKDRGATIFR